MYEDSQSGQRAVYLRKFFGVHPSDRCTPPLLLGVPCSPVGDMLGCMTLSRRQLPLLLLAVANAALAVYLLWFGGKGIQRAEGTGEGLLASMVMIAGVVTGLAAVPALWWSRRAAALTQRGYAVRLVIAAVVAGVPWVVVAAFIWPAEWRIPRDVPAVCSNAHSNDPLREIGKTIGGVFYLDKVFEPMAGPGSRDFVYVVPKPDGGTTSFAMDCSSPRCRPKTGSEGELLNALHALPPCRL
jgi:hypothetical protein